MVISFLALRKLTLYDFENRMPLKKSDQILGLE